MTGYSALSLFSGCGGFCEGVRLAGFDVRGAVEHDRFACETYRANFPEVPLFEGDVHDFLVPSSLVWEDASSRFDLPEQGRLGLLFGGPPCQGYSQIGTRVLDDPRNELYLQYIRVLKALQPRVFLMENVPNMLLLAKGRFKREVLEAFADAGYANSGVAVIAATDYGVPQLRKRAIFFGVHDSLSLGADAQDFLESALLGERQEQMTVWEAICDLPETTAIHYEEIQYPKTTAKNEILDEMRLDRNGRWYSKSLKSSVAPAARRLQNHHTKEIQERRRKLIKLLAQGAKADSLPKEIWNGARPEKWRRLDPNKPAYTILAQMHRDLSEWVHPNYQRWITVREAARLQSFHDGFVFKSSEWQMLKQVGNAVPPLMGRALGAVANLALRRLDGDEIALPGTAETASQLTLDLKSGTTLVGAAAG